MKVTDEMVGSAADRFENAPNDCTLEEKLRDVLEAALADVPEPVTTDMRSALQAWWEQHALALRMTSRSVHRAIAVAISALEQGKPFPTMQVLMDGHDIAYWRRNYAHAEEECTAEREMAQQLEAKLDKVRAWRSETLHGSGIAVPDWAALDAILDETP